MKDVQKLIGWLIALEFTFLQGLEKCQDVRMDEGVQESIYRVEELFDQSTIALQAQTRRKVVLYLSISPTVVNIALVCEEGRAQLSVYYVSHAMIPVETRYLDIEKLTLALLMSSHKLCPYFQACVIVMMISYPLCQVLHKPDISGRLMKKYVKVE